MAWGKSDDNTAFHLRVMACGSREDERQLNEVWGFVHRAFCWSASVYTDGFVPEFMVDQLAGARGEVLVKAAQKARLLGKRIARHPELLTAGWYIDLTADELLNLRPKAEVEAERAYRAQLRDPESFGPVRLRDGDQCRYCGNVVNWKDGGKTSRGGTLDHIVPGEPDLVVACKKCNSQKQDKTPEQSGLVLQPAPVEPFYGKHTIAVLERHGFLTPQQARTAGKTQPMARTPRKTQPNAQPQARNTDAATGASEAQPQARPTPEQAAREGPPGDQEQNNLGSVDRGLPDQVLTRGVGSGQVGSGLPEVTPAVPSRARGSRGSRGRRQPSTPTPKPGATS